MMMRSAARFDFAGKRSNLIGNFSDLALVKKFGAPSSAMLASGLPSACSSSLWLKLHAPLAGNGKACASAAAAYLEGRGVPRDEAKAAVLLGKGCESSSARACSDLCDLYIDGKGVPKNAAVRTSS